MPGSGSSWADHRGRNSSQLQPYDSSTVDTGKTITEERPTVITYLPYILIAILGVVFFVLLRIQSGATRKPLAEIEKRLATLENKLSSVEAASRDEIRKIGEEKDLKMSQLREELRSVLNSFVENTGKKLAESTAAQKSRFDELNEIIVTLQRKAQREPERKPLIETPPAETTPVTRQLIEKPPVERPPVEKPAVEKPAVERPAVAESPAHAKAKRLARLIVSDIVLYNQAAVEEGIRNNTFNEILAHDIREAHTLYAQRVPAEIRNATTYLDDAFAELIVRKKRELNIS
jgi:hypothetical protein